MENINCPLCSTIQDKNNAIEILSAETLIKFWRVSFSINISTFIKEKNIKYFCCSQCELGFFHPYAGGDDTFYNKLSKLDWYYLHADKTEYFYTKKLLDKKMKVLDIGCGRGVFSTYIESEFYGLELNKRAVQQAKEDGINVINRTIEEYSISHYEEFDFVFSFQVLEHIKNIDSFIESALRVLKVGGEIVLAVPNRNSFIKYISNHLLDMPPHHSLRWNDVSLKYLADKNNLEILDIYYEKVTPVHTKVFYIAHTNRIIKKILFKRMRLLDSSKSHRIINKFSSILSRLTKYTGIHKSKNGQTIIIRMRKS